VRYLFLADADAVVAAGIIVSDVGMKRFYGSGPAVMEMALLKSAALVAGHPHAEGLVSGWRNISGRVDEVLRLLTRLSTNPLSHYIPIIISKLSRLLVPAHQVIDSHALRRHPLVLPQPAHGPLDFRLQHRRQHRLVLYVRRRFPASAYGTNFPSPQFPTSYAMPARGEK
jgi:hypothetical protein